LYPGNTDSTIGELIDHGHRKTEVVPFVVKAEDPLRGRQAWVHAANRCHRSWRILEYRRGRVAGSEEPARLLIADENR